MKRLFIIAMAGLISAATLSAQDMATATETYNNGAMSLQMGDNSSALLAFQQALETAEACDEAGLDDEQKGKREELISNCKTYIPKISLAIAKDYAKVKDYDNALSQIAKAIATAEKHGNEDVAAEAVSLRPQLLMQKANGLLRDKKFAEAAQAYKDVVADDPQNGRAHVMLGNALVSSGATADAIAAYEKAATLGQEKDAYKQLSNIYVKTAAANLKAQKYQAAVEAALKSNDYLENATAYKVAAQASVKLNNTKTAIGYFENYLKISPNAKDAADITYTIAAYAQQGGDKAKAKEYYQKLVADPKYGETAKQQIQVL